MVLTRIGKNTLQKIGRDHPNNLLNNTSHRSKKRFRKRSRIHLPIRNPSRSYRTGKKPEENVVLYRERRKLRNHNILYFDICITQHKLCIIEQHYNFIYIKNVYENKFCNIFDNRIFDSKYIL